MANITLSIPDALLQKAKDLAHRRGQSMNSMVREQLEKLTGLSDSDWWASHQALLNEVRFTQEWTWNRDDLYDRD